MKTELPEMATGVQIPPLPYLLKEAHPMNNSVHYHGMTTPSINRDGTTQTQVELAEANATIRRLKERVSQLESLIAKPK